MNIGLFSLVMSMCLASGAAIGFGLAREEYKQEGDAASCHIEAAGFPWSGSGYSVELIGRHGTISPFRYVDDAISTAAKVGCKLAP